MQGTLVQFVVWEDPTCSVAAKSVHPNYWACTLEPLSYNYWSPHTLETEFRNKRSHPNEKTAHRHEE